MRPECEVLDGGRVHSIRICERFSLSAQSGKARGRLEGRLKINRLAADAGRKDDHGGNSPVTLLARTPYLQQCGRYVTR